MEKISNDRSDFAKRNEPALSVIPQCQANAGEALGKRDGADVTQIGIIPQNALKRIERDTATKMMNVVQADICGEPMQDRRQFVV